MCVVVKMYLFESQILEQALFKLHFHTFLTSNMRAQNFFVNVIFCLPPPAVQPGDRSESKETEEEEQLPQEEQRQEQELQDLQRPSDLQ